jgi:protein-disulfide isomerase
MSGKFYKPGFVWRVESGVATVLIPPAQAVCVGKTVFVFALALTLAFVLLFAGCASAPLNEGRTPDGRAYRGAASPKVTIYEYSDFECPFCGQAVPVVDQIMHAHASEVQLQFRNFPLTAIHPRAMPSAVAGVCADYQGKFWGMYDKMFANQQNLGDADLLKYAQEVGLNMTDFSSCIASKQASDKVQADVAAGNALGVQGTPTFLVGSTLVVGTTYLQQAVETELAKTG